MKKYTPLILTSLVAILAVDSKGVTFGDDDINARAAAQQSVVQPLEIAMKTNAPSTEALSFCSKSTSTVEAYVKEVPQDLISEIKQSNPLSTVGESVVLEENLEKEDPINLQSNVIDGNVQPLSRTQRALKFVRNHPAECFLAAFAAVTLYKNRGVILPVLKHLYDQSPKALPFLTEKAAYVKGSVLPAAAHQVSNATKMALSTVLEKAYGVHTQFKDAILPVVKDKANGLVTGAGQLIKNYKYNG